MDDVVKEQSPHTYGGRSCVAPRGVAWCSTAKGFRTSIGVQRFLRHPTDISCDADVQ